MINMDKKWEVDDYNTLVRIIEDVCTRVIKDSGLVAYKAAKISSMNSDGTYNLILPGSNTVLSSRKSNLPSGSLEVGDSVELSCKGGNLGNSWITVKHGIDEVE